MALLIRVRCDAALCVAEADAVVVSTSSDCNQYAVPQDWQNKDGKHLCPTHKENQ